MRNALAISLATAVMLVPAAASAQSATTTRIETRPFYGATVTLEEGVRVFRPLPPHQRVIINPNGATPLSLGFEENHAVSHNYNYGDDSNDSAPVYVGGDVGGVWGAARHGRKGRHGGHGHSRGGVLSPGGHGHGGGHGGHR
jgi:hypothetical protein